MIGFLGDRHGVMESTAPEGVTKIIQVGDFGVYPGHVSKDDLIDHGVTQRFIRGNHENHAFLAERTEPFMYGPWEFMPDGWVDEDEVLYMGGAWSIDRAWRQSIKDYPGFFDHWDHREQMSIEKMEEIFENIKGQSFKTIVTHEAPEFLFPYLVATRVQERNRTAEFLDRVFANVHTPLWVFGHHHKDLHMRAHGTDFYCVNMETWKCI